MTNEEWKARAAELFGPDMMTWKFVCPSCGHVQATQDYKDAGAQTTHVAFSCVGRYRDHKDVVEAFTKDKGQGCNYAGGGLIGLNPLEVDGQRYFDFYIAP